MDTYNNSIIQFKIHQLLPEVGTTVFPKIRVKEHLYSFILLLESENPNESNPLGLTALMIAIFLGMDSYVDRFIKEGRNLDLQDKQYKTALMYACQFENEKVVSALIKAGCNLDLLDDNITTALMQSCRFGRTKMVVLLVEAGCKLNLQDRCGETALMTSCSFTDESFDEIVSVLISGGCDLDVMITKTSLTALRLALIKGRYDAAMLLIKNLCDIDSLNTHAMHLNYERSGNDMKLEFIFVNFSLVEVALEGSKIVNLLNEGIWTRVKSILCERKYTETSVWFQLPKEIFSIILDYSLLKFYKTK